MKAYCLFDVQETLDEAAMESYRQRVFDVVAAFEGRYVVIGGPFHIKEGAPAIGFPVMIEFPTLEHANRWYESPEYREMRELRKRATRGTAIFFEGWSGAH
jgi:uncharacterized protein (DUF1330 family)